MNLTPQIAKKLGEAQTFARAGSIDRAEKCLHEAIRMVDKSDKSLIGSLYINLGSLAGTASRTNKAIKYYLTAIEYLKSEKGEAILQNAHSHFNIAKIYLEQENEAAVQYSTKALDLYMSYPLTSTADIVEARLLYDLALAFNAKPVKEGEFHKTWQMMKSIPFHSLNSGLVEEFLSIYLQVLHHVDLHVYENAIYEIEKWADEIFAQELSECIRLGPAAYALKRRLRRAGFE